MPYERIVQWLAGPVSTLIALAATALVHQNISHSAALLVATFILSSVVSLLAHFKWFSNLAKYWEASGLFKAAEPLLAPQEPGTVSEGKPESAARPDAPRGPPGGAGPGA